MLLTINKKKDTLPFNQQVVFFYSVVLFFYFVDNNSFNSWNALNLIREKVSLGIIVAEILLQTKMAVNLTMDILFTFTITFGSMDLRLCSSSRSLDLSVPAGYILNLSLSMTRTCCKNQLTVNCNHS